MELDELPIFRYREQWDIYLKASANPAPDLKEMEKNITRLKETLRDRTRREKEMRGLTIGKANPKKGTLSVSFHSAKRDVIPPLIRQIQHVEDLKPARSLALILANNGHG
jgi:hypothetical protein